MNAVSAAVFDPKVLTRLIDCAAGAQACEGVVPSPCQSICVMDQPSGWCTGCLRNINEIAAWGGLGDEPKRQIWAQIERRAQRIFPGKESA